MKASRIALAVASALGLGLPHAAAADPVTVTFSGTIAWIDDEDGNFGGYFALGDPFTGTLVYDPDATVDDDPDPSLGSYYFAPPAAPIGLSVTLHGVDFASDPTGPLTVAVLDSLGPGVGQGEDSFSTGTGPLSVPAPVSDVGLWLFDGTASAFDSDALPAALDLADFDSDGGSIASGAAAIFHQGASEAWGRIDTLVTLPEPGGDAMVAVGIAALAVAQWARRRREAAAA